MIREPEIEHPSAANAKSANETFRLLFLDSADNIVPLKAACKEVGYTVVGATSIDEVWAFLHGKNHVDVIVCAAHLEEESVFRLLHEVRQSDVHGKSMFLILSLEPSAIGAKLDVSMARAGIALGADGYLVMPVFDAAALIAEIRKLHPRIPMLQQSATEEEKLLAQ